MCDNRNELHKSEYSKSKVNTSTRLDLDITETTDSYPEFDFLDLLRKLQVKEKKSKVKSNNEESTNKSSLLYEEDSDVETLARLYEEKYGTCNDYAELGEGYDEEDSFIDNSDAVNDLVPSGIQTEFGGFYINRGKLNFVKEDNSSSSTSEDVDKFLAHNRLNSRKNILNDEGEVESGKIHSNNQQSSASNITCNFGSNNNFSSNNNGSLHNNIIKSRKKSGEFQHKNKKIRKTATPKIPEHLLHKKPFPGSSEYRKNMNEFKKNRLKAVESDKKSSETNIAVNNSCNNNNNNNNNNISSSSHNNNNNEKDNDNDNEEEEEEEEEEEDDDEEEEEEQKEENNTKKICSNNNSNNNDTENDNETCVTKKRPLLTKDTLKESEINSGNDPINKPSSSSSETSESSSSDSDSDTSEGTSSETEKVVSKTVDEIKHRSTPVNGSISKDITAKSFAHLSDSVKDLIAKIFEISKEEKNKIFNSKLNSLLLSLDDKLRELPMGEKNLVLDHVAEILQMKKENIIKRTKKLLVLQEENKLSASLRKLKEAVASMMPLLESNYFNEYTKAAGTSPQIYAELSRHYWSIDPGALPQKKFPWNDELRHYLREIVHYRKNCYYIIKPRKESVVDYIKNFMETKVKVFWPKEWMTVEILLEEAQVTSVRQTEEKQKPMTKVIGAQHPGNITQKKTSGNFPTSNISNRKQAVPVTMSSSTVAPPNRKSNQGGVKNTEAKSILIPRRAPQGNNNPNYAPTKPNFTSSSVSSVHNINSGSCLQVTLNRINVQDYLDRISGSQTSISRSPNAQISSNRSQQSASPNRMLKTSPPNSVLNASVIRPNVPKNVSPNSANKTVSAVRNCNGSQSMLKTIEIHSNTVANLKTSPNSLTISPVNESVFKDASPNPEVLNLTKNSSVYISKVNKDLGEAKSGRCNSPIGIPLPSGITISPTNASPSTFLVKSQKLAERNSEHKINVSITKQESLANLTKEKKDPVLNMNLKREGPLQNIPDCISVTSKVVPTEKPKYEHVRKRALQEYHQQQNSPERLKMEEKKMKTEENILTEVETKDDKLDDKNFSKIFESVIAKTTETVRQSENISTSQTKFEKLNLDSSASSASGIIRTSNVGISQSKNNTVKSREIRVPKDKPFYLGKNDGNASEKSSKDTDEKLESMKEKQVQMEMDRVMQNLVELSREKKLDCDYESQHINYASTQPTLKPSRYPEPFQKVLYK